VALCKLESEMVSTTQFSIRRPKKHLEGVASFSMNIATLAIDQRIQIRLRPADVEDKRTFSIYLSRKEALEWAEYLVRYGSRDTEGSVK
jgi:hypothetical protein